MFIEKETIISMIDKIKSRGPDSGFWFDYNDNFGVGHKRLSILDLTMSGNQPMLSKNSRYVIAFNGEIYNHIELRKSLDIQEKINWIGSSDTETLITCIEILGIDKTLEKINGMFSCSMGS